MNRQKGGKGTNAKASSSKGMGNVQCNSISEMVAQIKGLAKDPCRPHFARENVQPLWNQILSLRNLMVLKDSEIPWRKRKLEQLIKGKLRPHAGFVLPRQHNITKVNKSSWLTSVDTTRSRDVKIIFGSRSSSSLVTFDDALPEKQAITEHLTVDSDESVNGPNPASPENSAPNEAPPVEISNAINYWDSPISDWARRRGLEPSRRSRRLLNFIGDHLERKAIPVGPRFQADVPDWDGPADRSVLTGAYKNESDNSNWLGSRVWPIEIGNMRTTSRKIGQGRHNSCRCASPGSADCIKCHVLEERLLLQCDLGPAFFSWKFDEMGDQVLKLWSLKEQQTFESLMKTRPSSNGKSFWKRALKSFSNKCRKDIVNYYFNVYVPQRMSLQRMSPSIKQVDTDDEDEEENIDYMGLQKRSERRSVKLASNIKGRYLRSS